jgi:Prealbumin-like fold domain
MAAFKLRRRATRRRWAVITATTAMTAVFLLVIGSAVANLPNSSFDAGDGNLVVNGAEKDWANIGIDCPPGTVKGCALDQPTGQTDDSFGQGTKEDTPAPVIVDGSIPNQKSDLLRFYVANEKENNKEFLYLAWERVQEPNGTTNMDFEFNQRQCTPGLTPADPDCSANGVTPIRSPGDVLIKYDLSQGGVNPNLGFHRWVNSGNAAQVCEANNSLPCWDKVHPLAGNFEGAINDASNNPPSGSVVDPIDPNGGRTLSPRTFGEAAVNLTDSGILPAGTCASFGSAYLKSRSSDSFTAAVKDFIAPIPVNIANCGRIIIRKQTDPNGAAGSFSYSTTGGLSPASFSLSDDGVRDYGSAIQAGSYSVTEADPSPNFVLTSIDCSASSTANGSSATPTLGTGTVAIDLKAGDVIDCTYTNTLQRGALRILKNSTKAGAVSNAGAVFSYDGASVTDNGPGDDDADVGEVCVSGLQPGNYTVNETSPPAGYGDAGQSDLVAVVANGTNCTDNQPTGTGVVTFTNAPLYDLQVNFRDGGSGETSAVITCSADPADSTAPASGWDTSSTYSGRKAPDTVTCTIVIDP